MEKLDRKLETKLDTKIETKTDTNKTACYLENLYCAVLGVFLIFFFLETTKVSFLTDTYYLLRSYVVILLEVVVLCRIFASRCPYRVVLLCGVMALILLLAKSQTGDTKLFYFLLALLGAYGISGEKLMKVYLYAIGGGFLFVVLLMLCGQAENLVFLQGERRVRMSLGICYPTDCAAYVFYLSLAYTYIRRQALKWWDILVVLAVNGVIFYLTDARTSFCCALLFVGGLLAYKWYAGTYLAKDKDIKGYEWFSGLLALAPVLCAGGMILLTVFYTSQNSIMAFCNKLLTDRLALGKMGIDVYGFSWRGQNIAEMGNGGLSETPVNYFYLDSSYVRILLCNGILVFVLVMVLFLLLSVKARKYRDTVLLWILALVALQNVMEHHLLDICYNPFFWLLLSKWETERIEAPAKNVKKVEESHPWESEA